VIEVLLQAEGALSLGLLDRAEILYRQVVIADPRNSIAVVGLARVALERGDEPGALRQARRALGIDPENTAARRMVERLEEVLRYRGIKAPAAPEPAAPPDPAEAREPAALPERVATPPADAPPAPEPPTSAPGAIDRLRSIVDRLLRRR